MSILLVAGVWLLLGVIFCLASGRGIAIADANKPRPRPAPAAPTSPRTFTSRPVHEWALAAHTVATDQLLAAQPGPARRVAAT